MKIKTKFAVVVAAAVAMMCPFTAYGKTVTMPVPSFSNYTSKIPDYVGYSDDKTAFICSYSYISEDEVSGFQDVMTKNGYSLETGGYEESLYVASYASGSGAGVVLVYDPDNDEMAFSYPAGATLVLPDRNPGPQQMACPYCSNGHRKEACDQCGGTGRTTVIGSSTISCYTCSGTGKTPCYTCYQSGKVTNPDYIAPAGQGSSYYGGGYSYPSVDFSYPDTSYSGSTKTGYQSCPTCRGGTLCKVCGGTGTYGYLAPGTPCTACNGTGDCWTCGGTGHK